MTLLTVFVLIMSVLIISAAYQYIMLLKVRAEGKSLDEIIERKTNHYNEYWRDLHESMPKSNAYFVDEAENISDNMNAEIAVSSLCNQLGIKLESDEKS